MTTRLGLTMLPIWLLAVLLTMSHSASAVTDEEVGDAIDRIQQWFYSEQDATTGEWASDRDLTGNHVHGEHVLVTYAMLASGESAQDPRMAKALRFLRGQELQGTYARGISAHVWAQLPDAYLPNLGDDAQWLLKAQKDSLWDYGPVRRNRIDHSTTQYGILGLWEFSKRGGKTPKKVWEDAVKHFLSVQRSDGAWTYSLAADSKPRGSMTAAGLTVLYVALQELYRNADTPPAPIMASIDRGVGWLDQHFSGTANPGGSHFYYYLYGIERVGLASGIKTLNGQDWFEAGAETILRNERGRGAIGTNYVRTAFALGFLARGRVPIWITKLEIPGTRWNNRPNDIYFLTRYLSDLREAEINWQRMSIDEDPVGWADAPVAYVSSDERLELSGEQVDNLRSYLNLGGLLMVNSESRATSGSMQKLVDMLYPGARLEPLPEDHLLYSMITPVSPRGRRLLQGYHNGVRDVIVMSTRDMGLRLQSDTSPSGDDLWKIMTNLYVMATDRGQLPNRLVKTLPERTDRSITGEIEVARARYDGRWDVERDSWHPLAVTLFNRTGLELKPADVPLESLSATSASLVHLVGVDGIELSELQKKSIKQYVEEGGTLLVETIGGRGDFSVKVEEQLRGLFDQPATPVAVYDPLLSGQGTPDAFNIPRVVYRSYSVVRMSARNAPRLAAINVNGRAGIIFSHEDLSMGALGIRHWGINGYSTESARELLTNIVLSAKR